MRQDTGALWEMKFNPKKSTAKLPMAFLETYDVEKLR